MSGVTSAVGNKRVGFISTATPKRPNIRQVDELVSHEIAHTNRGKRSMTYDKTPSRAGGEEARADVLGSRKSRVRLTSSYDSHGIHTSLRADSQPGFQRRYQEVRAILGKPVAPRNLARHEKVLQTNRDAKALEQKEGWRYD